MESSRGPDGRSPEEHENIGDRPSAAQGGHTEEASHGQPPASDGGGASNAVAGGAPAGGAPGGVQQLGGMSPPAPSGGPVTLPGLCRVCSAVLPTTRESQPVVTCQRSLRYANKHRFCVEHLKADQFVLAGEVVRFCQKCSRLQPIAEFSVRNLLTRVAPPTAGRSRWGPSGPPCAAGIKRGPTAVNRTCQEKLKAHNARSRERYAAGEGNKKKRGRSGGADGDNVGAAGMMAPASALHSALGGWGGGARGMGEPLIAPHDFTAAQLRLATTFTSSVLVGWPAAGSADQVMQLLLSQGGAQLPWTAPQAAQLHAGAAGGGPMMPQHQYYHGGGAVPAGLLHPQAYSQLPPPGAVPGGWPMSELYASLGGGPVAAALDDVGALPLPPASALYGMGVPPPAP